MFGKLSFDSILQAVRNKEHLYVPASEFAGAEGTAVKHKVGMMDFLKVAQRRHRQTNPIAPNQADIVNWVLYDRLAFSAGTTVSNANKLFILPIGQNSKTKVDTNLQFVSQLESPQWMNVTGMGFFFNGNVIGPDLDGFLNTEYMEFWVSNKVYLEGPLQCFPSGAGRFGNTTIAIAAAATNVASVQGNGWPVISNLYDVRLPAGLNLGMDSNGAPVVADGLIGITILQSQSFYVKLNADGGGFALAANNAVPLPGTGLTVACYIHGILSRGVQ